MSCKGPHVRHRAFLREMGPGLTPGWSHSRSAPPRPSLPSVLCPLDACACGRSQCRSNPRGVLNAPGPFIDLALEKAEQGRSLGEPQVSRHFLPSPREIPLKGLASSPSSRGQARAGPSLPAPG